MAVLALESLLLPEIRTQLKKTFTRRLSSLLAASAPPDVETLALIPKLYSLRSESVHGAPLIDGTDALVHGSAERLLAFAIRSIGALVSKGRSISDVRQLLDEEHSAPILQVPLLLGTRPRAANDRFQRGQPSDVFAMTSSMAAEDGQLIAWAPLIGLGWGLANVTGALMGTEKGPALMPLEPQEFMDLEERDIRRDYLAGFVAQGHQMSVLFILAGVGESADDSAAIARLNRQRDLAVTALRLAGYSMFRDPELFGSVVFEGKRRLRQATVLRQTVAEGIRHPAEQHFSPADQPRVAAHWDSLARYDRNGQCPSIEYLLSLYRRTFDDFLTAHQRVLALFSLMESMIGRFRPPDDALQLDAIVAALLPQGEDTEWLRLDGRRTRNAFAHGDELSAEEVEVVANSMTRLVSGLLAAMIETWNAASEESRSRRPSALLIARAASERG